MVLFLRTLHAYKIKVAEMKESKPWHNTPTNNHIWTKKRRPNRQQGKNKLGLTPNPWNLENMRGDQKKWAGDAETIVKQEPGMGKT